MSEDSDNSEMLELQNMNEKIQTNDEKDPNMVKNRVSNELKEMIITKKNPHSISWWWPLITLAASCLLFYIIHLNDGRLPKGVVLDDALANPSLFCAERARKTLKKLVMLGPRVVGDEINEIHAPNIIENEVNDIILNSNPSQIIKLQRQNGSGAFQLDIYPSYTNVYENVQNIIVMIEGSEGNHSILVNCHYDSFSETQGGSNNGVSCSVMLELIRVISASKTRLKHNIVFLFNGAGEVSGAGAHLFLSHPWKEKCKVVLNLKASGVGGRSMLVQSGPKSSWIFNYYAKYAPRPHGQVIMEELFSDGIIPSDADFKIFKNLGGLVGLEFSFIRSGHIYHTKYDEEKYIPLGSYQHLGDNTLALLKKLGNAQELYNLDKQSKGQAVYYDYLGWFMISYSVGGSIALNIFTIILAIFSVVLYIGRLLKWPWLPESTMIGGKKYENISFSILVEKFKLDNITTKPSNTDNSRQIYVQIGEEALVDVRRRSLKEILIEMSIAIGGRIVGMGMAIALTLLLAMLTHLTAHLKMPWYNNNWGLFPVYWLPCLVTYCVFPHLFDSWRAKKHELPLHLRAQLHLMAILIIWVIVYFILTIIGVKSATYMFLPIFCASISHIIIQLTPLYQTAQKWVWVYLAMHIPALLMSMYLSLLIYTVYWPTMGRSGVINADVKIAIITWFQVLLLASFVVPLMSLISRPGVVFTFVKIFAVVMSIMVMHSQLGHPYKSGPADPKPQRYWIMHSLRELRNETGQVMRSETGYFVLNLDGNSPKTIPSRQKPGIMSLKQDCKNEYYCGLPLYTTKMISLSSSSSWIPSSPPAQPYLTELILKNGRRECIQSECSLTFILKGPDRMTLTFTPRSGASLTNWSIPTLPTSTQQWKRRPSYFVNIVRGNFTKDYEIKLSFKVTPEQFVGQPILDIGLAGNHVHHEDRRTKAFQKLLDSMPDWVDSIGWISAYKGYVF